MIDIKTKHFEITHCIDSKVIKINGSNYIKPPGDGDVKVINGKLYIGGHRFVEGMGFKDNKLRKTVWRVIIGISLILMGIASYLIIGSI